MKLKEIHRTSTFAWSPGPSLPYLATGTAAGALDASFSNESQLEIWCPDFLDKDEYDLGGEDQHGPRGVIKDNFRFHRLAWGPADSARPQGIIAAGMENGELALWDPVVILKNSDSSESHILRNSIHTGPVRGLDFNPIQTNLLSSGGIKGEVYVWDLKDPSKPYSPTPGSRSVKLDEITSLAWNQQVQYVLAGASNTGYTVVWDLRGKREVVALAYGGGNVLAGSGGAMGSRRGMSDIAWHPDNATRLVTASEDDSSPIVMVWDLRNARAPEKILTGHEKGVLSLSWCKQDADLLLSCGKDNRALCWNPQTSEIIGELPSADNWAFQVDWCPRNPDILAAAFFDGTIGIHSVHTTNDGIPNDQSNQPGDILEIFDTPGFSRSAQGTLSLKQPPKWLRRPTTNSWGFGGQFVTSYNLVSTHGKNPSGVVHIRKVVTEQDFVDKVKKLQAANDDQSLSTFAEAKCADLEAQSKVEDVAAWKALLSLFKTDSRDELVTLLGFSKEEIASRIAEAAANAKISPADSSTLKSASDYDLSSEKPHGPVVSFAEPGRSDSSDGDHDEKTPSEVSASVASDITNTTRLADGESTTTTAPSLFGDDVALGNPQDAEADFFSTIGFSQSGGGLSHVIVPHHNYGVDSSVAATIGSGPSSVISESSRTNAFKICPSNESETDLLVTKALVLGDFEGAVQLCLCSERYPDAILLAVRGGPELLRRTQKAYFDRQMTAHPYLRLLQSIVTNDLSDIVQNADLKEWQEILVVLCTFATKDEFPGLAEELGSRLEYRWNIIAQSSDDRERQLNGLKWRKNATLTYLAAGRLERLVNIWLEELVEEEKQLVTENHDNDFSQHTAHVLALQTFIEKITIFRSAISYVDDGALDSDSVTFKLSGLYDRYLEYAGLLASQSLTKEAVEFLRLVPRDYKGPEVLEQCREQLLTPESNEHTLDWPAPAPVAPASTRPSVHTYTTQAQISAPVAPPTYPSYAGQAVSQYVPQQRSSYQPSDSAAYPPHSYNPLQPPSHLQNQPPYEGLSNSRLPAPQVGPPPKRHENGGWNDAPVIPTPERRSPASLPPAKPAAIMSPFPNVTPASSTRPSTGPYVPPPPAAIPPPPARGESAQGHPQSNPRSPAGPYIPSATAAIPPPPTHSGFSQGRPQSAPQGMPIQPPPRNFLPMEPPAANSGPRIMSPPQTASRQPPPGRYAPGPSGGPTHSQTPPPDQYTRIPPPPGSAPGYVQPPPRGYGRGTPPPPPVGQFGRSPPPMSQQGGLDIPQPPLQQPTGPYGPPPGVHRPVQVQPPLATGPPAQVGGAPSQQSTPPRPPPKAGPKYPVGDRSHIPDYSLPVLNVLSEQLSLLRQSQPQQKRLLDDMERRLNPLFDALNCETLSRPVVDQLLVLTRAMAAHDREAALSIHVDLLTRGSQTDDIGLWMSGVKQLILRL